MGTNYQIRKTFPVSLQCIFHHICPFLCAYCSRMELQKDVALLPRIYDISSQATQKKVRDTQTQPYQPGLLRVKATVTPVSVSKQEEC